MKKLLLGICLLSGITASAQDIERDVFGSSGSVINNASIQMSFTIGETFTATLSNNEIHTLGFQQANKSGVSVVELSDIEFGLYPNPASEEITFFTSSDKPFEYKILDVSGRIVLAGYGSSNSLLIDVSVLQKGKYFFEYLIDQEQVASTSFITIN